MANLNKVMLIGRLTRDPEVRTFANGGKVAHFGFADVVGAALDQELDAPAHIVRGVTSVGVDPTQDLPLRFRQPDVHRGRRRHARVGNGSDERVKIVGEHDGSIGRASVHDENLDELGVVLGKETVQAVPNPPALVECRKDD